MLTTGAGGGSAAPAQTAGPSHAQRTMRVFLSSKARPPKEIHQKRCTSDYAFKFAVASIDLPAEPLGPQTLDAAAGGQKRRDALRIGAVRLPQIGRQFLFLRERFGAIYHAKTYEEC